MAAMLWALREMRERLPALGHEIWFAGLMSEEADQHGSQGAGRARSSSTSSSPPSRPDSMSSTPTKAAGFLQLRTTRPGRPRLAPGARRKCDRQNAATCSTLIRGELAARIRRHPRPGARLADASASARSAAARRRTSSPTRARRAWTCASSPRSSPPASSKRSPTRAARRLPRSGVSAFPPRRRFTPTRRTRSSPSSANAARTPVGAPWFCDACFFAERGMPAVALGPGFIAQAHTKDEFIAVADLEKGVEFFTDFLARL